MTQKPTSADGSDVADVAIRDAEAIVARVERDERDAEEARERYRSNGLPEMLPDTTVAAHLEPGEGLIAVRASAQVGRDGRGDDERALAGPLYLTTRRLLLLGRTPLTVDLSMIDEVSLAGERLLVSLGDGSGVEIQASGPRLLRVQIAAAMMGARTGADPATVSAAVAPA